ncbi:MAG: ABC transporter ATP-binding protein [Gemmatimonadaceae bacterium]
MTARLVLRGVRKRFGATVALDDARCEIRAGTVHALLGENGAGKTTLMRIAFGIIAPERGVIELDGMPVRFRSSADAISHGIGMVHQHFMLVPAMTVAENVALGGRGRFDRAAAEDRTRAIGRETGLLLDPSAKSGELPVGAQQRLEIVKALAHDARILILDEPTAVLSPGETVELYAWLRRFASRDGTVVLITHRLEEALEIADDVTILRAGRTVLESAARRLDTHTVIAALTGDPANSSVLALAATARATAPKKAPTTSPAAPASLASPASDAAVFVLEGVGYVDAAGVRRLSGVNLRVAPGEILGVIGVEGAGQHELLRIMAGRLQPTSGRVTRPTRVGFVPEDRSRDALVPSMSLVENFALAGAGSRRGLMDWSQLDAETKQVIKEFDVRTSSAAAKVSTLSGGNQQKLVVGRERSVARAALVAENPTRGLDIRASERVRREIGARRGTPAPAVIYHSSDLDEVLAVATRVVACFGGRVSEVAPPSTAGDRTPYTKALMGVE